MFTAEKRTWYLLCFARFVLKRYTSTVSSRLVDSAVSWSVYCCILALSVLLCCSSASWHVWSLEGSKVVSRLCVLMKERVPWYESVESFNRVGDLTIQRCQCVKKSNIYTRSNVDTASKCANVQPYWQLFDLTYDDAFKTIVHTNVNTTCTSHDTVDIRDVVP